MLGSKINTVISSICYSKCFSSVCIKKYKLTHSLNIVFKKDMLAYFFNTFYFTFQIVSKTNQNQTENHKTKPHRPVNANPMKQFHHAASFRQFLEVIYPTEAVAMFLLEPNVKNTLQFYPQIKSPYLKQKSPVNKFPLLTISSQLGVLLFNEHQRVRRKGTKIKRSDCQLL